jgi:diguanylate cyclase (GGDEF)-like protein
VLLAVACLQLPAAALGQRLNVRHYTSLEGIPQRQVFAVLQGSDGHLWLGTYGGLSRYNGAEFRTYTTAEGLSENSVQFLAEDRHGRLVVATIGGGLCFLEGGRFRCLRGGAELAHDSVLHVAVDRDGTLWAATEGGLTRLRGGRSRHFGLADGLPSEHCRRVVRDPSGTLWVGTRRGLARLDGNRFVPVADETLGERTVTLLFAAEDGLWIGTEEGIHRLREGVLEPLPLPAGMAGATIAEAAADPEGTLWIATSRGALRWDGERFERLTERQGLLSDTLHRVMIDREGNVWFAGEAGLSKLVPGPLSTYGVAEGLPNPFVRAIREDLEGRLWVGTRNGAALLENGVFRLAVPGELLPDGRIYSFAPLPEGGVLVGSRSGLVLWRDGVQRIYTEADGLPSSYVTSMLADPPRGVWLGTDQGLAYWREGHITAFTDHPLLASGYVLSMARDGEGRPWLGLRSGGVAVLDGEEVRVLDARSGLTDQTVWSLARDSQGRMWVASNGDGAFRVDGGSIRRYTTREGLVNDFVWQALADSAGAVWLFTNRGLARFDGNSFRLYDQGDGLVDLEGSAGAAWEDRSGDLWFGTALGLVRYDRAREEPARTPPPVVIEEAYGLERRPLRPGESIPFGSGLLTFRFAAPSFRDESAVRYRHRLRGASDEWSEPTAERRIGFAGLEPGSYHLEVQASQEPERWSEPPASFAFAIAPAFWQTVPFRILGALLVVAAAVAASGLRTRQLERERRRLESTVASRTLELQEKNSLLAQLASIDDLTQLHNRRRFLEQLELELRKLARSPPGGSVSLLLIDLDRFKEINDRYGHLVGDRLLRAAGQRVAASVRVTDFVARYGGEELAVIMPATDASGARIAAEKARAAVAHPIELDDGPVTVTASIGVASISGLGRYDEDVLLQLIRSADAALYRAKDEGRNRVVAAARVCWAAAGTG